MRKAYFSTIIFYYAECFRYALNGAEAVELCWKVAFDIVIMDVMMPDMDGFAACEAIRRERDIPVLMLSARGAEYDRLLGFEAGVDDYVVKPFLPKELMARVRVIVSRHQSRAQRPELVLGGLRRVLYNLIDNALCHSENGRNVQVSLTGDGTRVRTEVRDRGEGIPEEELPYIWDRYFTAKQREAAGGGTGLGLAIVKEILKAHHAKFGVESHPGQGCTFWFELKKQNHGS